MPSSGVVNSFWQVLPLIYPKTLNPRYPKCLARLRGAGGLQDEARGVLADAQDAELWSIQLLWQVLPLKPQTSNPRNP